MSSLASLVLCCMFLDQIMHQGLLGKKLFALLYYLLVLFTGYVVYSFRSNLEFPDIGY